MQEVTNMIIAVEAVLKMGTWIAPILIGVAILSFAIKPRA